MKYFLKKCGSQELGSMEANQGIPQRGRYLLISMKEEVLSFFPPLTTTQLNDFVLLPIIPLYLGKKVYCTYVYHNDKYHGSTARHKRNEHRIYLNNTITMSNRLFRQDDIVIFRDAEIRDGKNIQKVYYMDLVNNHSSQLYTILNNCIDRYPIRGGFGIYSQIINEFEQKINNLKDVFAESPEIDPTVTQFVETQSKTTTNISGLFDATTFRDWVMVGYENLCAITRTSISGGGFINLEAAHIMPKSHGGLYLPNNGIALSQDLHWAFDKGFFTLNDDLTIKVHEKVDSPYLKSLNGKKIFIPNDPFFAPNIDNIKYHRENVYGLFLTSGRL